MKPGELTQVELFTLANSNCPDCGGCGCGMNTPVCECVFRRIFEACYERYCSITPFTSHAQLTAIHWSRPREEFRGDFVVIARRALFGRPKLRAVFDSYFADESDSVECLKRLEIHQGVLFRRVVEIKQVVGRALREQEVYPIDRYFTRTIQPVTALPMREPAKVHQMPAVYEFEVAA
jgi:hypothetical protein